MCCAPLEIWTGILVRRTQETHGIYSKPIGAEDGRGPLNRTPSESTRMSLEKWSIEEDWTLCYIEGWQCSINCSEIKWGSTVKTQQYETAQKILLRYQTPYNVVRLMALMRVLIVSWFVLLCMVAPIGAQIRPAPTSDFTASDAAELEEHSAYDEALAGVERIRRGKLARKNAPFVTICSQQLCSRFSLSPALIVRIVTAFPRSHALRVHQRISVYRI